MFFDIGEALEQLKEHINAIIVRYIEKELDFTGFLFFLFLNFSNFFYNIEVDGYGDFFNLLF